MKNIKKKRSAKGMTQEQLAAAMRVHVRTVMRWEKEGKVRACYHTDLVALLA